MRKVAKASKPSLKNRRRYSAPVLSEKSRWSYIMQGASPDQADGEIVERLSAAFGERHPAWLIASQPWRKLGGDALTIIRTNVLRLSIDQVAAYLRVAPATVRAWEAGRSPVPFAVAETFRLLSENLTFKLSHPAWDGWFINRKTGELVSPDIGRLAILPAELNALPYLYGERASFKSETERLQKALDEAVAENTHLRTLFLNDGVTDELHAMQAQLHALMSRIGTARVVEFGVPSKSQPERKAMTA